MSSQPFELSRVQKSLSGYVSVNNNLRYYRKTNVIVRNDLEQMKSSMVRIITGGGSGHEPAHIGYIGKGMLTAVVCGEVFASPSVTNILSAILTVARADDGQILLIVKNYTGDRLNFGLAAEIAKSRYGYRVRTVLVDDDCAIENVRRSVGRRGLAGTILIHKIAGAMAVLGADVDTIADVCRNIVEDRHLATVGFTFHDAGAEGLRNIEIGRGIHGEPGTMKIDAEPNWERIVDNVLGKLYKQIPRRLDCVAKPEVILLLNNFGGTSEFTMATFANALLKPMKIEYDIRLILSGTFMSSFQQEGISVTVLEMQEQRDAILTFLKLPVRIAANVPFNVERDLASPDDHPVARYDTEQNLTAVVYDERCYKVKYDDVGIEASKKALLGVADILLKSEKLFNNMDAEFGDGDTGTLIACAAKGIQSALNGDKINFMYPCITLHDLSEIIQRHMGGSLGAVLAIFLEAAAEAFIDRSLRIENTTDEVRVWLQAMKLGVSAVMKYGFTRVGDRTIVDALVEGIKKFERCVTSKPVEALEAFVAGCEEGANSTKTMLPKAGRAAYAFSEGKEFKPEYNDPGAAVISVIARAVIEGMKPIWVRHGFE